MLPGKIQVQYMYICISYMKHITNRCIFFAEKKGSVIFALYLDMLSWYHTIFDNLGISVCEILPIKGYKISMPKTCDCSSCVFFVFPYVSPVLRGLISKRSSPTPKSARWTPVLGGVGGENSRWFSWVTPLWKLIPIGSMYGIFTYIWLMGIFL